LDQEHSIDTLVLPVVLKRPESPEVLEQRIGILDFLSDLDNLVVLEHQLLPVAPEVPEVQ
jgi:hypothetical protein